MLKPIGPCAAILLLTACAVTVGPSHTINEIVVVNNTRGLVRDVSIRDTELDRVFSCGNIAPSGICSNRFARRPYRQNPIRIEWTVGDATRRSGEFVLEVPATLYQGLPLRGVLEISPPGQITVYFEQDTPGS